MQWNPRPNILVCSAGRRIGLIRCIEETLRLKGLPGAVYAVDASEAAPARFVADASWQVPRCSEGADFVSALLELARRENIGLIVPTIDPELGVLAEARNLFAAQGVAVWVSGTETIDICRDKARLHAWLKAHRFPVVSQRSVEDVLDEPTCLQFPLIVKPRTGSASLGVRRVAAWEELVAYARAGSDLLAQEVAPGVEFTINLYVDRSGRCVCVVPHERLEIRAGEVSKAITLKHLELMELGRAVAEALPDAWGPLNVQCFLGQDGSMRVIEINARFGGGYPLVHRAGARFTDWIVEEWLGLPSSASFDRWEDNLAMLRYDEAVFVSGSEIGRPSHEAAVFGV